MRQLIFNILILSTFTFPGTIGAAQFACTIADPQHKVCSRFDSEENVGKGTPSTEPFSGTHWVKLSWNPSTSLHLPLAENEGYNVYRWSTDKSCRSVRCVPVNAAGSNSSPKQGILIKDTKYQDFEVESGKIYRYSVTAVRGNEESNPTNIVEVEIPGP